MILLTAKKTTVRRALSQPTHSKAYPMDTKKPSFRIKHTENHAASILHKEATAHNTHIQNDRVVRRVRTQGHKDNTTPALSRSRTVRDCLLSTVERMSEENSRNTQICANITLWIFTYSNDSLTQEVGTVQVQKPQEQNQMHSTREAHKTQHGASRSTTRSRKGFHPSPRFPFRSGFVRQYKHHKTPN